MSLSPGTHTLNLTDITPRQSDELQVESLAAMSLSPPLRALLALLVLCQATNILAFPRAIDPSNGRRSSAAYRQLQLMRPSPPSNAQRRTATVGAPAPINVLDHGADGSKCPANSTNGAQDNTAAFQSALDAAAKQGGGVVHAPAGCYMFLSSLIVHPGVTLEGSYGSVPSHSHVPAAAVNDGTVLSPCAGRGDTDPEARFIDIGENGALKGVTVYYTEQEDTETPVPYPWTIFMHGNNAAVADVELLNPWNGINATGAHRHYIARVQGQPINIGVLVDATYDIGRLEDVHWNPWFSDAHPFIEWQLVHGRAFVLGRSDWEYVFNTFAFGYAIGYHFIQTPTGTMNGNFLGIGMDLAINASVQVDAAQPPGLLITNGEFTAFGPGTNWLPNSTLESTQVVVNEGNTGPVKFVDSSFWGPSSQVALLKGQGVVSFSSCEFVEWDLQKKDGRAAIRALNGSVLLQGNDFQQNASQVEIASAVQKAVIVGNILKGPNQLKIDAAAQHRVQMSANAFDL